MGERTAAQATLATQAAPATRAARAAQPAQSAQADAQQLVTSDKSFSIGESIATFLPLWPYVLGMAFARDGLIVGCYGSYDSTDEGVFTDGTMLVALSVFALLIIVLFASKHRLSPRTVFTISVSSIICEALCLVALAAVDLAEVNSFALSFFLCVLCTIASSLAMFYWLRSVVGAGTVGATLFVFCTLAISEVLIYLCGMLPIYAGNLAAAVLALAQFGCMGAAKRGTSISEIADIARRHDYFSFTKSLLQSSQFLIATAIGIGVLAFVIGFLRGYPGGLSIGFTPITRIGYGLMTIVACACFAWMALRNRPRVMTVGIFLTMEALACLALVLYAAFPDALCIGAMLTTTLNALMCAYCWYVVIAFATYGWRDPYYYALAGWLVCFGSRGVARMALLAFYPVIEGNDMLVNAIMGALVVFSTQVVLVLFGRVTHGAPESLHDVEETPAPASKPPERDALAKIMGLDGTESLAGMRQASMRHSAETVGAQFLLSEREVDVLALYALGFTQKRVAEELFISPGTAHAHIKRIYAKTGMHSRQEILDYIAQYAS